jgi:hypothetical protein
MAAAVHNLETRKIQVAFVLELYDGVTGQAELAAPVTSQVAGQETGWPKPGIAQFVFLKLAPGNYVVNVSVDPLSPYYFAAAIPIAVPAPGALWPAFPDRTLANLAIPLDDPGQTAAYLAQRAQATLMPTAQYPFAAGANLARGTVTAAGAPLAGAQVSPLGGAQEYVTGIDGQYVLFFDSVDGMGQAATLQAVRAPYITQTAAVTLVRGQTVSQDFAMV